ncbi:putative response to unfolded-protein [Meredithblackwellia eburnea MCA 4105]
MASTTAASLGLAPPTRPPPLITSQSFNRALSANKVSKRPRSSSVLSITEVKLNYDDTADSGALYNPNADWVHFKGATLVHVLLLVLGKILFDILPGMSQDLSWTLLNLSYLAITYTVFHYVKGVPHDLPNNGGVCDSLTLWEQIDEGAHNTPVKKVLTTLPIALFLLSTHYTRYDAHPAFFSLNLTALVLVGLAPKLPYFHRLRFKFFDQGISPDPSIPPTPVERSMMAGERDFTVLEE